MSKFVTQKQFLNARSGQAFYYVTLNQFGVYLVKSLFACGKKVKSFLDPSIKINKRFVCKNNDLWLSANEIHYLKGSDVAVFKTRHGAERFIEETKLGFKYKFKVFNIVNRVRKQLPLYVSLV